MNVSTAACADACVQLGVPLRAMPLLPVRREWRVEGPARPVLHTGSVDAFLEACETLYVGDVLVVVGDADGILLVPADRAQEIMAAAAKIVATETAQADAARKGQSLREQLDFAGYLAERERNSSFTLREHLRRRGGSIER